MCRLKLLVIKIYCKLLYLYFASCRHAKYLKYMYYDECVCLSVWLPILKTTHPNFTRFSVRVIWGHGLVILWWQWNTLSTSGSCGWCIFPIVGLVACGIGNIYMSIEHHAIASSYNSSITNIFPRLCHNVSLCRHTQWQQIAHWGISDDDIWGAAIGWWPAPCGIIQEGQHPLTEQRAPPISGGT